MMPFTNYLENMILDEWFGGADPGAALPATLYIGLSSTEILDGGTGYTEPPGAAGYARAAIANTLANWPATGGDGTKSNDISVDFGPATADWGAAVGWFFIADAATGGNVLAYSTIGTPKTITNGDTASFGTGSLTITLD